MEHPNKAEFVGVLAFLNEPSDTPPAGARGHKVIMTDQAAREALNTLIGMGVSMSECGGTHNAQRKIGIIDDAEIRGNYIWVSGYLFKYDLPDVINTLQASEEFGMSYEIKNAHIENMHAPVWTITKLTFTGAAVLKRDKAAYKKTDFKLA